MVRAALLSTLAVLVSPPAPSTKVTVGQLPQPVTSETLLDHVRRNEPELPVRTQMAWLDNGARILISVAMPQAQAGAGRGENASYVPTSYMQRSIDVRTGTSTNIGRGFGAGVATRANVVAYYPEGSNQSRLIVARPGTGPDCEIAARDLMRDATAIEAFALAPGGDQIAIAVGYGVPRFAKAAVPAPGDAKVRVLDTSAPGAWGNPEAWGHNTALWVLNSSCAAPRRITDLSEARFGTLAWSNDDRNIVGVSTSPQVGEGFGRSTLRVFDSVSLQYRTLAENIGNTGATFLQPAPSGPYVAFGYDKEGLGYSMRKQFAITSIADGRLHLVSVDPRERPRWLDNRTVLSDISSAHPLTRQSVILDLEGRETERADIPSNALPSPDGRHLAWLNIDLYGAASISVSSLRREQGAWMAGRRRVIWRAESPLAAYVRAERRLVRCESTDGVHPEAILVLPIGYKAGRRYPLIVDLHGGPRGGLDGGSSKAYEAGSVLVESTLEHDFWTTRGYAVLVADYRASGVYGFDKVSRTGDAFAQDFRDIMCNVDAVIRDGVVDPERMAVIGHSYGGMEVNWIVTHTDRFKAAISKEAGFAVDQMAAWAASGHANNQSSTLYGTPIANPDIYRRMSPINFTRGVTTPTMFVSHVGGVRPGDLNGWMFAAWRNQGIDAQYRIYDDPNHVLGGEADQKDQLNAAVAWIDRYLSPSAANVGGKDGSP